MVHRTKRMALAALVLATACGQAAAPASEGEETLPTRLVKLSEVSRGDVIETLTLTGELQGTDEVRIYSQVAEHVVSVPVVEGERVKSGSLLAVLQAELLSAGEAQAQAALDAAKANLRAIEDNLTRTKALASSGAVTPSQLESLEAQKAGAEAQVRQLGAAATQASTQRARSRIVSPIPGVVTALAVRAGDLVSPSMPVMTIVRDDRLKAVLRMPERDFLRVEIGMPVRVSPLARPDLVVAGEVSLRGGIVDRSTRTGHVEVHIDNRDRRLVAGSTVQALVEFGRREGVVLVPSEAVLFTTETDLNGKANVFVEKNGRAERRAVKVGVRQRGEIEIVEGLEPGERLVSQGAAFLRDGNPIQTVQEEAKAGASSEVRP